MEEIYDTNDAFQFDKLVLSKPTLISGGNYFIRCLINNNPLYIQPPKCTMKQGIMKAGKRFYADLMFTNENDNFIRWMENLENHCQQYIHKNREKWFDGEMDLHDIENYFTSPLKIYKSGKFYIARTNVPSILGKPTLKIYDEKEKEIEFETIDDKTNVMTILEIQGIKCSANSFQIDLEIKQIMTLTPSKLFEKCIIKTTIRDEKSQVVLGPNEIESTGGELADNSENILMTIDTSVSNQNIDSDVAEDKDIILKSPEKVTDTTIPNDHNEFNVAKSTEGEGRDIVPHEEVTVSEYVTKEGKKGVNNDFKNDSTTTDTIIAPRSLSNNQEMEEVEFHLEELPSNEYVLKKRNDVYYEMYKDARKKAKIARYLALASYLEAKRIKNTYMLDDRESDASSESDLEELTEDGENN